MLQLTLKKYHPRINIIFATRRLAHTGDAEPGRTIWGQHSPEVASPGVAIWPGYTRITRDHHPGVLSPNRVSGLSVCNILDGDLTWRQRGNSYDSNFTDKFDKTSTEIYFADVFIFRSDDAAYSIPESISSTSSDRKINTSAKIFRRRFSNCVVQYKTSTNHSFFVRSFFRRFSDSNDFSEIFRSNVSQTQKFPRQESQIPLSPERLLYCY